MLFNSDEYILCFLPIAFIGFYILRARLIDGALGWIIFVSLFFYAWWRPFNLFLIAPSIFVNFALAKSLIKLGQNDENERISRFILLCGILFNVLFLGYFKYLNFVAGTANDLFGTNIVLSNIILPLGISFITFQKIAFLMDVHAQRIKSFTITDYCLFVLFFPQLIAGPIVHYSEMMPQFKGENFRYERGNLAIGLTLFFSGLFKKVIFADHLAPLVTPIYEQAANERITLFAAWIAAVGFTLQIYFDFAGYSEMALGSARLFGIRLPANFNSPLQATSIIDFWQRWHMTLTRFLTAYIFNPLVLRSTRRRLAKGAHTSVAHKMTLSAFFDLVAFPTLLTMLVSGLWHGAGYTYIVWGFLHGLYLATNHAWRLTAQRAGDYWSRYERSLGVMSFALTFVAIAVSMAIFRSATIASSVHVVMGMFGLNGVSLPASLLNFGNLGHVLQPLGVKPDNLGADYYARALAWIVPLLFIAVGLPNTLHLLDGHEPALGLAPDRSNWIYRWIDLRWTPSLLWCLAISFMAILGIVYLGDYSEFLYWQF